MIRESTDLPLTPTFSSRAEFRTVLIDHVRIQCFWNQYFYQRSQAPLRISTISRSFSRFWRHELLLWFIYIKMLDLNNLNSILFNTKMQLTSRPAPKMKLRQVQCSGSHKFLLAKTHLWSNSSKYSLFRGDKFVSVVDFALLLVQQGTFRRL